jgi:hypothetical protein
MRCVHSTISGSPAQAPCNWPWTAPGLFPRQAVRRWRGYSSRNPPASTSACRWRSPDASASRRENVTLDDATATFSIQMQEAPRTIAADPDFDVFRLLYPEEIPATVNAVKGSSTLAAVLAEDSPEPWAEIFRGLLMGLNHGGIEIWSESRFAAEDTAGKDVLFFGMPKREKGRNLLSELGDAAVLSAGAFQVGEDISSRNADTMFAVFKRNRRLVAVFLSRGRYRR